jgi:hypothetical protein
MRRVFRELIGRIIEAYIDDIVVKSKKTGETCPRLSLLKKHVQDYVGVPT